MSDDNNNSTLKTVGLVTLGSVLTAGGMAIDDKLKVPVPEFKDHACEPHVRQLISENPTYKAPEVYTGSSGRERDSQALAVIAMKDVIDGKTSGIIEDVKKTEEGRNKVIKAAEDQNSQHYGLFVSAAAVPAGLAAKATAQGIAGWRARNREERQAAAAQGRGTYISG